MITPDDRWKLKQLITNIKLYKIFFILHLSKIDFFSHERMTFVGITLSCILIIRKNIILSPYPNRKRKGASQTFPKVNQHIVWLDLRWVTVIVGYGHLHPSCCYTMQNLPEDDLQVDLNQNTQNVLKIFM